jgi:transposase InsO family protein
MAGREGRESTSNNEFKKREGRGRESPPQNLLEYGQDDFVGTPLQKARPSENTSNLAALKLGVRISIGGSGYWAEVDTGAWSIWVSEGIYLKECESSVDPTPASVVAADGTELKMVGTGTISFTMWGKSFCEPCKIMKALQSGILIGRSFWRKYSLEMLLHSAPIGQLLVDNEQYKGRLYNHRWGPEIGSDDQLSAILEQDIGDQIEQMPLADISSENRERFRAILLQYQEVFKGDGKYEGIEHIIQLKPGITRCFTPPRKKSILELKCEREQVEKLLAGGVLEPVDERIGMEFISESVFVPKRNGTIRTTSDYRKLNANTVTDGYALPDIEEVLNFLGSRTLFTCVDLRSGYFQIPLAYESRRYTCIRTCMGLLQYTRMPQGLKNAPATFQRIIHQLLADLPDVRGFLDDLTLGTMTEVEHIMAVEKLLKRLLEHGLRLNLDKCEFGVRKATVLGHEIQDGTVRPSEAHLTAIHQLKEPTSFAELLRFLGLVSYFSKFIECCAVRSKPLYEMLVGTAWNKKKRKTQTVEVKGVPWGDKWKSDQKEAWTDLKAALADPGILVTPRTGKRVRVVTDASGTALGGVLLQEDDGAWRTVGYVSRKLKGAELRYTATELECLACIFTLGKFRHLLHGRSFTLWTDHIALKWLLSLSDPKGRLARWVMAIQDLDYTVVYAPGSSGILKVADALSRDVERSNVICTPCTMCGHAETEECSSLQEAQHSPLQVQNIHPNLDTVEDIVAAQEQDTEQYSKESDFVTLHNNVRVIRLPGQADRIVAPVRDILLRDVHGNPLVGHWGVERSYRRMAQGWWWPRMREDIEKLIKSCVPCTTQRLRPKRQARMVQYHPRRRFEIVACDVLEIKPASLNGNSKVLVIGDCFTRFIAAVPIPNERAETLAKVLLDHWILLYGPPEKLLSDRGPSFMSSVLREVLDVVGCRKIYTSAFHPQTDGMIERFNRTLCEDLAKMVLHDERWDELIRLACFQYNTSVHSCTGISPYRAMYGRDPFGLPDAARWGETDDKIELDVAAELRLIYDALYKTAVRARGAAAKAYDKAVKETPYDVGDRVMIFVESPDPVGRKLLPPWMGPFRLTERLSSVGFVASPEGSLGGTARVHVNRLRKYPESAVETQDPRDGMYPDSRRMLRMIQGHQHVQQADGTVELQLKKRAVGRRGYTWVPEHDLPTVVVKAYFMGLPDHVT